MEGVEKRTPGRLPTRPDPLSLSLTLASHSPFSSSHEYGVRLRESSLPPCTPRLCLLSKIEEKAIPRRYARTRADFPFPSLSPQSQAFIILKTEDEGLTGQGMTFTIGRGNEIVCAAITLIAERLKGKKIADLFADMGRTWDYLVSDPQLRWIGPEKGVIAIATGAVSNALWDLYARHENKPLWKVGLRSSAALPDPAELKLTFCSFARQLIVDFTPVRPSLSFLRFSFRADPILSPSSSQEEFVRSTCFRYITDAITPAEALALLKEKEAGKAEREKSVIETGYPA